MSRRSLLILSDSSTAGTYSIQDLYLQYKVNRSTVNVLFCSDNLKNRGVYIENNFNFGGSENHNDVDLFMRFRSSVKNGVKEPTFYTDMNGFQVSKQMASGSSESSF